MMLGMLDPQWRDAAECLVRRVNDRAKVLADRLEQEGFAKEAEQIRNASPTPSAMSRACVAASLAVICADGTGQARRIGESARTIGQCADRLAGLDRMAMTLKRIERQMQALDDAERYARKERTNVRREIR